VGADFVGDLAVNREAVVDKKFVSGLDGDEGMNKDTIACLDGLAVGRAGVVDEARAIAAATAVDDPSIRKAEDKGVVSAR